MKDLSISPSHIREINKFLTAPSTNIVKLLKQIMNKYGDSETINKKAEKNGSLPIMLKKLQSVQPKYLADLYWLQEQRDKKAFVSIESFRKQVLERKYKKIHKKEKLPVILEISALQYFPWIIEEAKRAIKYNELMPARFISVRKMKEQERDGDLLAIIASMKIIGASFVETLDTKGTDGSNVHLGGPDTITGYFGGIGEPNEYVLKWIDEYLYYYTNYGVQEVLNINPGTILAAYLLYKLGVNIKFKISVFMGNDNPYAALWTMIGAKLFSRKDGTTPLIGFNWSNSVNTETLLISSQIRKQLGFESDIRFEHHIVEAYRHIVRQPYNRREDLLSVAGSVPNISAKHEGGEVETEQKRKHSSSILDYFLEKKDVMKDGLMLELTQNYIDKHIAVNITARELAKKGFGFLAAPLLHY